MICLVIFVLWRKAGFVWQWRSYQFGIFFVASYLYIMKLAVFESALAGLCLLLGR